MGGHLPGRGTPGGGCGRSGPDRTRARPGRVLPGAGCVRGGMRPGRDASGAGRLSPVRLVTRVTPGRWSWCPRQRVTSPVGVAHRVCAVGPRSGVGDRTAGDSSAVTPRGGRLRGRPGPAASCACRGGRAHRAGRTGTGRTGPGRGAGRTYGAGPRGCRARRPGVLGPSASPPSSVLGTGGGGGPGPATRGAPSGRPVSRIGRGGPGCTADRGVRRYRRAASVRGPRTSSPRAGPSGGLPHGAPLPRGRASGLLVPRGCRPRSPPRRATCAGGARSAPCHGAVRMSSRCRDRRPGGAAVPAGMPSPGFRGVPPGAVSGPW